MAKSIAIFAIFALLSLALVNASLHRTIVRTEVVEENPSSKCRQQIQSQDLSECEQLIACSGSMAGYNQQCCQQLRQMDEECRCQALIEIVRKQQKPGQIESEEEMQKMMQRAKSIPTYCHMGPCQWSKMDNVNLRGCSQQVQKQDSNMCEKFITQSGQQSEIAMPTSNPEMYLQGCCTQLSQVNEQCRCEALKDIVIEKQQEGQFEGLEMHKMLQRAQSIPRMCHTEPRSCQWRLELY